MTDSIAPTTVANDAARFPSLAAMRAAHTDLLRRYHAQSAAPEMMAEVEAFMRRGTATGALLDAEADRATAQSQLDYWATRLFRPGAELPDATLDDFDPMLAPELDDALCPYVGLDAFREANQGVFFGRERLIGELLNRLQTHRLLAVMGSSGSGKSSVVRAGLIPVLKKGGLPDSAHWIYFPPIVPGSNPLANLARLMLPADADADLIHAEVDRYLHDTQHLSDIVAARDHGPIVLVVDQFEEVFTLCTDEAVRTAFVDNLIGPVQSPEVPHRVIVTIRTDFESNVTKLPAFYALFQPGLIHVTPLIASELREAIEAPAAVIGLRFEEGVVETLLHDTLGEPAALPLLQFTLLKLWENRERNRVTMAAYQRLGGRRTLGKAADDFYARLIPEEQVTARRILLKMVRPGEGQEITSNRVLRSGLYYKAEARDRIDRVLDKLIKARLVRVSEGDTAADEQIEVAHEALIRNWPRLVEWLEEERVTLRQRQRLTAAAEQWLRLNKDPLALWRGALLDEARRYDDLNELEAEFVQASQAAREAEERAAEAARRKQLDDAMRSARQARRFTRVVAIVGAIAIVFAIAAVLFGSQANQAASNNATLAATAQAEAIRAVQQEQNASAAKATAEAEQKRSRSRELAAVALSQIDKDPERGLLIAIEAGRAADTYEAQDALRQLLLASKVRTVLRGHDRAITSAQFSPDGQQIVTASADGTTRVWDAATGQEVADLRGHEGSVNSAQYSPNPQPAVGSIAKPIVKRIVTAGDDQTARVWDAVTGKELAVLRGHQGSVNSAQFSPDGQRIVTASDDQTARVWDAVTGKELAVLRGHENAVTSAQFSPDLRQIVTAGVDGTARVWDVATGNQMAVLLGHDGSVNSAQFSPNGQQIVTASADKTARVWDAATGMELVVLRGHEGSVNSAQFSPDGKQIVTASSDQTARVWNAVTGMELAVLRGHENAVNSAQFSPDGKQIVTASSDLTARVWDATMEKELAVLRGHKDNVSSAAFSPDGKQIVTASADNTARVWDATTGKELAVLGGHENNVWSVAFSPNGQRIVTASADKTARVWDAATGKEVAVLRGHGDKVWSAAFSPDGQRIVTASADKTVRVWDAVTGKELAVLRGHEDNVSSAAFSPDGQQIVTASDDQTARVWEVATGTEVAVLRGHEKLVRSAVFSPDGQRIVTASADKTVRVWDAAAGMALAVMRGHEDNVWCAAFSPDGRRVVTASADRTARVWDTATGKELAVLRGHEDNVWCAAFSPDGRRVVTASADKTARVWDTATGKELAVLRGHEDNVRSAAFSPDGRRVVTASWDKTGRVYFVNIEDLIALAMTRVTRELTCTERVQYLREDVDCSTP